MASMADLRRQADGAAQRALRDVTAYIIRHGRSNPLLDDTYRAAERVLDAIDEYERLRDAAEQAGDPEAPDYFVLFTESELRLMDGNR